MKRLILSFGVLVALIPVSVAAFTPLYANTWKVNGTNEQGTTSLLYCAAEQGTSSPQFCSDTFNYNPSRVTGTKYHSAPTRYGWELRGTPTVATCVPDSTHPERGMTLRCELT
jgi:hypothetical protein